MMDRVIKKGLMLMGGIVFLMLFLFSSVLAEGESRIYLAMGDQNPAQEVTVDVLIENAPPIYGADVYLSFDASLLEVVQMDSGGFLDPNQGLIIQNEYDNQSGRIDYALVLRNPAPEVEGDGTLLRITFRAKGVTADQTMVRIEKGQFGTLERKLIDPILADEVKLDISHDENGNPLIHSTDSTSPVDPSPDSILLLLVVVAGILGAGVIVVGAQLWRRRRA